MTHYITSDHMAARAIKVYISLKLAKYTYVCVVHIYNI